LTVVDLIKYGTANPLLLAYLWLIIDEQQSLLITGTTAVGKTTFLNSVAQFIKPGLKIVSIEDTAELQLTNVNWVPQVARTGYGPKKYGEVTMFDLLKAALRQRPDYLVVGEVRGREASVMFQAMATGHPALSTLHADSINAVMDRLTTRPIDLPVSLLENLDAIIFLEKTNKDGRLIRRVAQILEIEGYDRDTGKLKTNIAFSWDPAKSTDVNTTIPSTPLHYYTAQNPTLGPRQNPLRLDANAGYAGAGRILPRAISIHFDKDGITSIIQRSFAQCDRSHWITSLSSSDLPSPDARRCVSASSVWPGCCWPTD
jgi:energy-coupling factor transporter ATP-binding protein EcfA2